MAAWLDRQLPDGAKVWSSPALRAEHTARALERKFRLSPALAPLSGPGRLAQPGAVAPRQVLRAGGGPPDPPWAKPSPA